MTGDEFVAKLTEHWRDAAKDAPEGAPTPASGPLVFVIEDGRHVPFMLRASTQRDGTTETTVLLIKEEFDGHAE